MHEKGKNQYNKETTINKKKRFHSRENCVYFVSTNKESYMTYIRYDNDKHTPKLANYRFITYLNMST